MHHAVHFAVHYPALESLLGMLNLQGRSNGAASTGFAMVAEDVGESDKSEPCPSLHCTEKIRTLLRLSGLSKARGSCGPGPGPGRTGLVGRVRAPRTESHPG